MRGCQVERESRELIHTPIIRSRTSTGAPLWKFLQSEARKMLPKRQLRKYPSLNSQNLVVHEAKLHLSIAPHKRLKLLHLPPCRWSDFRCLIDCERLPR